MAAQFKSNIRMREEKGFGSITMKRLIFCGVGAVSAFMLLRLTPLASASLPMMVVLFVLLLVFSGPRGGIPLWLRLLLHWRGRLILTAWAYPHSLLAQLAQLLNIDPDQACVYGDVLFSLTARPIPGAQGGEWVLFADLDEAESRQSGLRLLSAGDDDGSTFE